MTVQRARFYDFGDVRIHEEEREPLGPGELRVEPVVAGMNPGTMQAGMTGEHARMREEYVPLRHPRGDVEFPVDLGQNGVGRVVEVGTDVEGVTEGDLVQGRIDYATESVMDVDDSGPVVLPDGADPVEFVFMTQGGVALNAIRRADLTFGDRVVVVGAGPIGLAVTRVASLAGARPVVANDVYENRLAVAESLGATDTTDATREDLVHDVFEVLGEDLPTEGRGPDQPGPDVVFDCAGVSDAVWAATKLLRHNGTLCVAAMHTEPLEGVNLGSDFHLRELDVVSAHSWGWANEWPWTEERNRELYADLAADGTLGLGQMVTDRVAFEDLPEANLFERLLERPEESIYGVVTF